MCVFMHGCMKAWRRIPFMYAPIHLCIYVSMYACALECMYIYTYACIHACMYAYVNACPSGRMAAPASLQACSFGCLVHTRFSSMCRVCMDVCGGFVWMCTYLLACILQRNSISLKLTKHVDKCRQYSCCKSARKRVYL
jgi:hypothetical protein